MNSFNLIHEPWIPVRYLDTRNTLVSLEMLFREASLIIDLDCPTHERIALMRLLVCITQAELGAPETSDDWDGFGDDMETRIPAYLNREDIHPHFNLFGDGPRFLQTKVSSNSTKYPISQIVFHYAAGNTPTLLDHIGESTRNIPPQQIARILLCYQNFFVGGSMASKVKGNGTSLKILHTILISNTLKKTILSNCIDQEAVSQPPFEEFGRPSWEIGFKDFHGFLSRLSPMPCALWLLEKDEKVLIEQGHEFSEFPESRDAYATVCVSEEKEKLYILRANILKGIWKDLHAVTALKQRGEQEQRAPLNLQSHATQYSQKDCVLWLGELVKAKDAKIIDSLEASFAVPYSMLSEAGRRSYEAGVFYSEKQSKQLYGAVKQYSDVLKNESPPTEIAQRHYWNALEQQVQTLLDIVRNPSLKTDDFGEGNDSWTQAVRKAALDAYEYACSRQTPRQLQAYAAGLRVLRLKYKKPTKATA